MDAVAARSHSSKATLYRQWQGKPQLVAAAMRHSASITLSDIDTGTLQGDLHEVARQVGSGAEKDTVFLSAIGHAAHQHEDLAAALREMLIDPEREVLYALLRRAVERGEVREDAAAVEFFVHMLFGALPARKILEERFADPEYLIRYIDAVVLPALRNS